MGSFRFLAEVGKTTTLTDVKTASIVRGWIGANRALAALIGVASLLLFIAKHKQNIIFLTGRIHNLLIERKLLGLLPVTKEANESSTR